MTRSEKAAQIWPLLTLCARQRQTLTYRLLGELVGLAHWGLGQHLEPIQSYCLLNHLPALTVLVVSEQTGLPESGFIAAPLVAAEQAKVFSHDWSPAPPDPAALDTAVTRLPSNGRDLHDLLEQVKTITGN